MNDINKVIIWDWSLRLFWALVGLLVYAFAMSFTYNDPEPRLFVEDSEIRSCLPENERTISQMTLQRHADGNAYLACEKHEAMGYGIMPRKPVHIQVAISEE